MLNVICADEVIEASGTFTSVAFHLKDGYVFHGLEYAVSGNGTCKITTEISVGGENWIDLGACAKGLVKTSGPGGDGNGYIGLVFKPAEFVRFKVTETGTSNSVTIAASFVQK